MCINWTKIFETFLGSLFAFGFAVLLFFITEFIKKLFDKYKNIEYLKLEIDYNLYLIDTYIKVCRDYIDNCPETQPLPPIQQLFNLHFEFSKIQNEYFNICLKNGYLYKLIRKKKLESNELSKISGILSFFSEDNEKLFNNLKLLNNNRLDPGALRGIIAEFLKTLEYNNKNLIEFKNKI